MNEEINYTPAEEAAEEINLSELLQLRRDKLEELRREGNDPFRLPPSLRAAMPPGSSPILSKWKARMSPLPDVS